MSKEIYLHIQEPCHENWEGMSPAEQGRFCRSCAKQVIDFSRMADNQILDLLSKAAGNTCGRFTGNQLERPLLKGTKEIPFFLKPYKLVLSSLVPLFIISGNASGQDKKSVGKVVACQKEVPIPEMMGDVALIIPAPSLIRGRVVDEHGNAIQGATILSKETRTKTVSDAAGNFSVHLKKVQQKATLQVSYADFQLKEVEARRNATTPLEIKLTEKEVVLTGFVIQKRISAKASSLQPQRTKPEKITVQGSIVDKMNQPLSYATVALQELDMHTAADSTGNFSFTVEPGKSNIDLSVSHVGYRLLTSKLDLEKDDLKNVKLVLEQENILDSAVVSGFTNELCTIRVGGFSVVRTVTVIDTLRTTVQKLFNNELFKAFPNPVNRGQTLHLRFKQEGDYSLQLFDNSGRLYMEKQLKMAGKELDLLLPMPAKLGSGVYYLKAVCVSANKQFIEKIVVP